MSTFLWVIVALAIGPWLIAKALELGTMILLGLFGAVALGVLYGIYQVAFDIPWNDDFVLFWSAYGLLFVLSMVLLIVMRRRVHGRIE